MASVRRMGFERLREQAFRVVENWTASHATSTSPPINELALTYEVRRLRFEPLLGSAGLSKAPDGFVVHVNTESYGVNQIDGTVLELTETSLKRLAPQVRFSVAHEIAHAVFFKEAKASGKSVTLLRRNAKALEIACNQLAGAMLLPKSQLVSAIGERLFDARHVVDLMTTFGVSATTFILRLKSPDMRAAFRDQDGILVIARDNGERMLLDPLHILGPYAAGIWQNLSESDIAPPWEGLHLGPMMLEFVRRSKTLEEELHIRVQSTRAFQCLLTSQSLRSNSSRILVGIRVIGHPEPVPGING